MLLFDEYRIVLRLLLRPGLGQDYIALHDFIVDTGTGKKGLEAGLEGLSVAPGVTRSDLIHRLALVGNIKGK